MLHTISTIIVWFFVLFIYHNNTNYLVFDTIVAQTSILMQTGNRKHSNTCRTTFSIEDPASDIVIVAL